MSLAPGTLPAGQRVYAIGDVHGCADRLAAMHGLIAADLARRPVAEPTVVHLGDYIDRGERSAGVLDLLARAWPTPGVRVINLLGNHEAMLLDALDGGAEAAAHWLANGGAPSLASWGVARRTQPGEWQRAIPPVHLALLRGLALRHEQGGYIFVHAGLRPGVALAQQSREDMLWIREPFLSWGGALPGVVVHGHTPGREVERRGNRIGVDTGAVMGGKLSCVVLQDDRMGLLRS